MNVSKTVKDGHIEMVVKDFPELPKGVYVYGIGFSLSLDSVSQLEQYIHRAHKFQFGNIEVDVSDLTCDRSDPAEKIAKNVLEMFSRFEQAVRDFEQKHTESVEVLPSPKEAAEKFLDEKRLFYKTKSGEIRPIE